jgi:hypothetical protein
MEAKGTSELKVFHFTVKASNSGGYAVCVKAQNLTAAKDCLEKKQGILAIEQVQESDVPRLMRERMNDPLECEEEPGIIVGYKPS